MTDREYSQHRRTEAANRDYSRKEYFARWAPPDAWEPATPPAKIAAELAAYYDARRLSEADVDAMAELETEGRTYNRSTTVTHE
jgi:hypothetical protein